MTKLPQKALHLYLDEDKANPKHIGHEYGIFEKYDGWFMYIDCLDGKWDVIKSKALRELPSMAHYSRLLQNMPAPKVDGRLIFEATLAEEDGMPMVFSRLNGLFNQKKTALKVGAVVESKTFGKVRVHNEVVLKCHDFIVFGKEDTPFSQRLTNLKTVLRKMSEPDTNVLLWLNIAETLGSSSDKEHWYKVYESVIRKYNNNGEGIILKRWDAPYDYDKRNANLLKIKCEKSFELRVVGKVEGKDKYEGTLGKLIVEDANGVRNGVSGMSDAERDLWWNDFSLIKDKIVEVQCMKVLANKSLREGRFKAVRYDKTEADEL